MLSLWAYPAHQAPVVVDHPEREQWCPDRCGKHERLETVAQGHQRKQVEDILGLEAAERGLLRSRLAAEILDPHPQPENEGNRHPRHGPEHDGWGAQRKAA